MKNYYMFYFQKVTLWASVTEMKNTVIVLKKKIKVTAFIFLKRPQTCITSLLELKSVFEY